ncbi:MAG: hypothetical protein HYU24_03505 [Candidatus Rokubacteria bacterium]|nr:hypothetical protein [Candidatus Rokubacteria bacterium]
MEFLAWPVVALILGIVAIFVFKQPLTRFLDRAEKIGKGGIQAATGAQTGGMEVKPSPADELLKAFDNALLVQREKFITAELERLHIGPGSDRERVLIRLLAALSLVQSFERTYTLIWGSQISALQFLNSAGAVRPDLLRPEYDQAAAREPALYAGYTFDQWLHFLEVNLFILRSADTVTISLEGREFLKYLLHQGYTLYKRG